MDFSVRRKNEGVFPRLSFAGITRILFLRHSSQADFSFQLDLASVTRSLLFRHSSQAGRRPARAGIHGLKHSGRSGWSEEEGMTQQQDMRTVDNGTANSQHPGRGSVTRSGSQISRLAPLVWDDEWSGMWVVEKWCVVRSSLYVVKVPSRRH